MSTAIPADRLRDMRQTARTQPRPRFVDPTQVARVEEVLMRRGETWAGAVLGRTLTRRSRIAPELPWLEHHDLAVLLLADVEEDRHRFDEIVEGQS